MPDPIIVNKSDIKFNAGAFLGTASAYSKPIHHIPYTEPYMKYDVGSRLENPQIYVRGNNQPWLYQMTNGLFRFLPSVASKVFEGASLLGEVAYYGLTGKSIEKAYEEGPLSNAFRNFEKGVEQLFPVYPSEKYLTSNAASKFFTTSFLYTDLADGLETLFSFIAPGKLLTSIPSLGKLVRFQMATKVADAIKDTVGIEKGLTGIVANTVYSTATESLLEGREVYEVTKEVYKNKGFSEDSAKAKAAEHAWKAIKYNTATLLFSNFFESLWIFGNPSTKGIQQLVRENKDLGIKLHLGKNLLKGAAIEGFLIEENIQNAIQRYEEKIAEGIYDRNLVALAGEYLINILGFSRTALEVASLNLIKSGAPAKTDQDEGSMSALIGSLLGGGASVYGGIREYYALTKVADKEREIWNNILKNVDIASKQYVENRASLYERDTENRLKLDDNGNPIISSDAVINQTQDIARDVNYLFNAILAGMEGNAVAENHNKLKSLSTFVYRLRSSGLSHQDMLDVIKYRLKDALTQEDAKVLGIENELSQYSKEIAEFSTLYDEAKKDLYTSSDLLEDKISVQLQNLKIRTGYYYKSLIHAIEKDIELASEDKKAELSSYLENLKKDYDFIVSNRNTLKNIFLEHIAPVLSYTERIKDIEKQLKDVKDEVAREKLINELDTLKYAITEKFYAEGNTVDALNESEHIGAITMVPTASVPMFEPRLAKPNSYRERVLSNVGRSYLVTRQIRNYADGIDSLVASLLDINDEAQVEQFIRDATKLTDDLVANIADMVANGATMNSELESKIQSIKDSLNAVIDKASEAEGEIDELALFTAVDQSPAAKLLEFLNGYLTDGPIQIISKLEDSLRKNSIQLKEVENAFLNRSVTGDYLERTLKKVIMSPVEAMIRDAYIYTPEGNRVINYETIPDIKSLDGAIKLVKAAISHYQVRKDVNFSGDPTFRSRILQYLEGLLSELDEIRKAASNIAMHRNELQLRSERDFVANVLAAIKESLPEDYAAELDSHLGDSPTFGQLLNVLLLHKDSGSKIAKIIEDKLRDFHTELKDIVSKYAFGPENINYLDFTKTFEFFRTNPVSSIAQAIYVVISPEVVDTTYLIFKDLNSFRELIDHTMGVINKLSTTYPDRAEVVEKMLQIARLGEGLSFLDSIYKLNISGNTLLEVFEKVNSSVPTKPTKEQTIAITQALAAVYSSDNKIPLVNGSAGSGKTSVILKWLMYSIKSISSIKDSEILLVSHSDLSTKVLSDSLSIANAESLDSSNLSNVVAKGSKAKLIIIDEALAANHENLISTITDIRKLNPTVKIILSGDPRQISKYDNLITRTTNPHLIDIIRTITINYRTSIFPIVSAANQFTNKTTAVSSVDIFGNNPKKVLIANPKMVAGVYDASEAEIYSLLSNPSDEKRLLIIDEGIDKAEVLTRVHSSVDVASISEVSGVSYPEVYVLLTKKETSPTSLLNLEENRNMYTAITRAERLAVVNFSKFSAKATQHIDPYIETNVKIGSEEIEVIRAKFKEFLENLKGNFTSTDQSSETEYTDYEDLTDQSTNQPTNQLPTEQSEEDDEEDLEEQTNLEDGSEKDESEKDISEKKEDTLKQTSGVHTLLYVNNAFVGPARHRAAISSDVNWSDVHLTVGINSDNQPTIALIATSKRDPSSIYTLAILSEEELINTEFGKAILNSLSVSSKETLLDKLYSFSSVAEIPSGIKSAIHKGPIKDILKVKILNVNPLTTYYSDSRKDLATALHDILKNILTEKFYSKYYTGQSREDFQKVYDKLRSEGKLFFRIYTRKEAQFIEKRDGFKIRPGVVYMVLKDLVSDKYQHNLYFEVQPKKLSELTKSVHYKNVKKFVDLVDHITNVHPKLTHELIYKLIEQHSEIFEIDKEGHVVKSSRNHDPSSEIARLLASDSSLSVAFDDLVKMVYGPRRRILQVSLDQYESMAASNKAIVGFIPVSNELARQKRAIDRKLLESGTETLPKTIKEYRELGLNLPEDSKVRIMYQADDTFKPTFMMGYVMTKNSGPLQKSLNALASSNSSIARKIQYGDLTFRVAPPAISSNNYELKVSKQYFSELRSLIRSTLKTYFKQVLAEVNVSETDIDKVYMSVETGQEQLYNLINEAKVHPELYGFKDEQAVAQIEAAYEKAKQEITERHKIKTLNYAEIVGILENGYTPMRRDSSVTEIDSSNVVIIDGYNSEIDMLVSRFDSAIPASITVQFGDTETPKVKTDSSHLSKVPKQMQNAWKNHVRSSKIISGKQLVNDLLEKYSSSLSSNVRVLLKIISRSDALSSIEVVIGNTPNSIVIGSTIPKDNTIVLMVGDNSDRHTFVSIATHELIHALTLKALRRVKKILSKISYAEAYAKADEETKRDLEFYRDISEILQIARNEAVKRGDNPDEVLFESTISEKDETEFIASLASKRVWDYLSSITIGILDKIFESILNYIRGTNNTDKNTDLANMLKTSFERYVVKSTGKARSELNLDTLNLANSRITTIFKSIDQFFDSNKNSIVHVSASNFTELAKLREIVSYIQEKYPNRYSISTELSEAVATIDPDIEDQVFAAQLEDLGLLQKRCK